MLQAVHALAGGVEGQQRVEEVGHAEAVVGPAGRSAWTAVEVVGVVGEARGELGDSAAICGDQLGVPGVRRAA